MSFGISANLLPLPIVQPSNFCSCKPELAVGLLTTLFVSKLLEQLAENVWLDFQSVALLSEW